MGDVPFGLVDGEPPEVRRVAAHLGERLLGGRPALGVRLPVGRHQRHAHVPGRVVHDVADSIFARLAQQLAVGVAALAAHQGPGAGELLVGVRRLDFRRRLGGRRALPARERQDEYDRSEQRKWRGPHRVLLKLGSASTAR